MKRIGVLFALIMGCLIFMGYALADQWHPASELRPGTFGTNSPTDKDYTFPGSLTVKNNLIFWGGQYGPTITGVSLGSLFFKLGGTNQKFYFKDGSGNDLLTLDSAGNLWLLGGLTVTGTGGNVCHLVGGTWYSCPSSYWTLSGSNIYPSVTISTKSFAGPSIKVIKGLDTSADNQWHTVECPNGYAMVGFSVTTSDADAGLYGWDGNLNARCVDISGVLDTASYTWSSESQVPSRGQDIYNTLSCNDGYIITGISAYAQTHLTKLKIKCTRVTINSEKLINSGEYTTMSRNNRAHLCIPGTFMHYIKFFTRNTGTIGNIFIQDTDSNIIECTSIYP